MNQLFIELLTKERVMELWPALEPLIEAACKGNVIAEREMDTEHVLLAAQSGEAAVFAGFLGKELVFMLILRFFDINGHKGADVMSLAGRHLLRFKAAFWEPVLDWLSANRVEFLDAYVPIERAAIYSKKFGFDESCVYMRMNLVNRGKS